MNRHIGQIALVVSDHERSADFYARVFGMDHIFGTSEFRGEQHDKVQQVKDVASSCRWLIDDRRRGGSIPDSPIIITQRCHFSDIPHGQKQLVMFLPDPEFGRPFQVLIIRAAFESLIVLIGIQQQKPLIIHFVTAPHVDGVPREGHHGYAMKVAHIIVKSAHLFSPIEYQMDLAAPCRRMRFSTAMDAECF